MSLLAEQAVVNCPPSALEDLFSHRPPDWLCPFLRLAGDAGEAAARTMLGGRGTPGDESTSERAHTLELGLPHRAAGHFLVAFRWRTERYQTLFRTLDGEIRIRPVDGSTVLSIEGAFEPLPELLRSSAGDSASRRAAEFAVRSLLAELRAAVEHGSVFPPG